MIIPLLIVIISILALIIIHRTTKCDAFKLSAIDTPDLGSINIVETYNYSSCVPKCLSMANSRNLIYNTKYALSDGRCIYNKEMNTPVSLLDSVMNLQTDPTTITGFESCSTETNTLLLPKKEDYNSITLVLTGGGGGSGYGITQGAGGAGGIFIKNIMVKKTTTIVVNRVGLGGLSAGYREPGSRAGPGQHSDVQFNLDDVTGYNDNTVPGLTNALNEVKETGFSKLITVDDYTDILLRDFGSLLIFHTAGGDGGGSATDTSFWRAITDISPYDNASGGGGVSGFLYIHSSGGKQGYPGADGTDTYGGGGGGSMGPAVSTRGGPGFTSPLISDIASALRLYNSNNGTTYKFATPDDMIAVGGSSDITEDYSYYVGCGANSIQQTGSNGCCIIVSKQEASAQYTVRKHSFIDNINQSYDGYNYYFFMINELPTPATASWSSSYFNPMVNGEVVFG